MSCPHYFWNNHYACQLKPQYHRDVDEDTYHRYCRDYNYSECPIYKNDAERASESSCYLTSACINAKQLPDNCYELCTLRRFRDDYLARVPGGKEDIETYYRVAPTIVSAIDSSPNASETWNKIYDELILPCLDYIERGLLREAYMHYRSYSLSLIKQFM